MGIILYLNKCAFLFKILNYKLSCFIAIHSCISRIILCYLCIICHNIDNGKIMAQTDLKVVGVMCRRDLYNARTEIHFNIIICYYRYLTMNKGKNYCLADKILIPFIVRINSNCRIAQKCFGTCGRKIDITAAVCQLISEVPEMTCLLLIFNLGVGN